LWRNGTSPASAPFVVVVGLVVVLDLVNRNGIDYDDDHDDEDET